MKRLLSIVLFGMVVLLMAAPVAAKSGQAVYDAWKAQEKKARSSLDRLYMVQEMEQVEDGAAFTARVTIWQNGKKQRMEQEILKSSSGFLQPGQKTVMIDDGTTRTIFHPAMGMQQMPSETDDMNDAPATVRYLRSETFGGEACDVIAVVESQGVEAHCWIARDGSFLLKREEKGYDPETVEVNRDFRKVKGFRFPSRTETYENGQLIMRMALKELDLKTSMPASLFDASQVKGYQEAEVPDARQQLQNRMDFMDTLMEKQMAIQQLYNQGKTEEAEAMEKELEKMMKQLSGQQ